MAVSGALYLASTLLWWWLACLAFGVIIGAALPGRGKTSSYLAWLVLIGVGLAISISRVVEGRAGLWFDTALLFVTSYFVGCCLGAWLRSLFGTRERIVPADIPVLVGGGARPAPAAAALPAIKPYQWQAAKQDGVLTLTGYVPSAAIKTRIMAAAKALLPKLSVTDRLQMGAGAPDGLETFAGAAFGHLAKLESGTASLVDTAYTLSGVAKSESARAAVTKMTAGLPAGFQLTRAELILAGQAAPATAEIVPPIPAATPMADTGLAEMAAASPDVIADLTPAIAATVEGTAVPATPAPSAADKPEGLPEPRAGKADDLKRIKGIGRQNEGRLHELGIWHFDQIAAWSPKEVAWVGHFLAFPGRIEREQWVSQAKALAAGEETSFSRRVDQGLVATSSGGITGEAPLVAEPMPAPPPLDLAPAAGTPDAPVEAPAEQPVAVAAVDDADFRPANALVAPRNGKADRLTYVNGIDEATEGKLNGVGIFHYDQIAQLSKEELAALSLALGAPGKATDDNWKGEAAMLAIGSDTDHSKAMKAAAASLGDVVPKKG